MAACVEDLRRDSCDLAVKREECMQRRKMRSIFHPFVTDFGCNFKRLDECFFPTKGLHLIFLNSHSLPSVVMGAV